MQLVFFWLLGRTDTILILDSAICLKNNSDQRCWLKAIWLLSSISSVLFIKFMSSDVEVSKVVKHGESQSTANSKQA